MNLDTYDQQTSFSILSGGSEVTEIYTGTRKYLWAVLAGHRNAVPIQDNMCILYYLNLFPSGVSCLSWKTWKQRGRVQIHLKLERGKVTSVKPRRVFPLFLMGTPKLGNLQLKHHVTLPIIVCISSFFGVTPFQSGF